MSIVSAYCMQTCFYFERLGSLGLKALLCSVLLFLEHGLMHDCGTVLQVKSPNTSVQVAFELLRFRALPQDIALSRPPSQRCGLFNDVATCRPTHLAGQCEDAQSGNAVNNPWQRSVDCCKIDAVLYKNKVAQTASEQCAECT